MKCPIADFVRAYDKDISLRLHMPGHKGRGAMESARYDITEVEGADELYAPAGIIAESEANAAALFGTRRTCYSTEGSSQCIKAMFYLAAVYRPEGTAPLVLAGRNVHKSFLQGAALADLEVEWLQTEGEYASICTCKITPEGLDCALAGMETPPCAVFVTSPDYLGNMLDIEGLAAVTHRHGTLLLVDNAHGAYLKLLTPSRHPMDLGADICCDSAHKTLEVLTGGAYLHIGRGAPRGLEDHAKEALALFGSTSPSYLILCSLDLANAAIEGYLQGRDRRLEETLRALDKARAGLAAGGWTLVGDEPLKVTIRASAAGWDGRDLARRMAEKGAMAEYADPDHLVLMCTPGNPPDLLAGLAAWVGEPGDRQPLDRPPLSPVKGEKVLSIRQAVMAPSETVPVEMAVGRICGAPSVSCPPAVPIAMPGELIGEDAAALFRYYGAESVTVVKK